MLDRWFTRIASPAGVLGAFIALSLSWALWLSGEVGDGRLVRFSGALLAIVSVMAWLRFAAHARRRGAPLWGWRWGMRTSALPFFDDEMRTRARLTPIWAVAASGFLLMGLAGLGAVSVAAGLQERAVGVVDLAPGERLESWQQTAPVRMPRDLGYVVRLARVDAESSTAGLVLSVVGSDWERSIELTPRVPVLAGAHWLSWDGVSVTDDVGGATLTVSTAGGAPVEVTANVGETVPVPGGERTVTILSVDPNRLGTLGPAVRVRLSSDGDDDVFWLHARAGEFQATRGASESTVSLVTLRPSVRARFVMRSAMPPWLGWFAAGFGGMLGLGLLGVFARPTWLRGRSGDYEIARFGGRKSQRDARVAAELLTDDAYQEWLSLQGDGGGAGR